MNIYDIAKLSGVSIATVSRVLNGSKNVSQKTRDKIMKVMEEEGYTPNAFARGLGLNTMRQIGLLVTNIADPYYAREVGLLENELRQRGFDVLLGCTGDELDSKKRMMNRMVERHVDALMLVGSALREEKDNSHIEEIARQIPVFFLNGHIPSKNIISIHCDEKTGVKECLHAMYQQGVRNPFFVYDANTYSARQKKDGFREGLAVLGISEGENEESILLVPGTFEEVKETITKILKDRKECDGIICSDDAVAVGVQKALYQLGMKIPLVGCNNSVLAKAATPSISSIDNMAETICKMAVQNLNSVLDGTKVPRDIVISAEFVSRETFNMEG